MEPHSRCNFIMDDKRILIGAIPISITIDNIINFIIIITMIIYVQDKIREYALPNHIKYYQFLIKVGSAPSKIQADNILNLIIEEYNNGGKIYIHCNGGRGRTGTIGAYILGKIYNWDVYESVIYIEKCRNTRIDTSRNFIPTPETNVILNQIDLIENG
jgi:hypothetical protein